MTLEDATKETKLGIKFKFTSPGTPQQNRMVKRAFATLYGCIRSMLNKVGFTKQKQEQMWAECTAMATKLEVVLTDNAKEASPHEKFYGKLPEYAREL